MKKIISLLVAILLFVNTFGIAKTDTTNETRLKSFEKLTKIISIIEQYYVDEVEIDDIINKSIDGLLSNLDAHSSYLNQSQFSEMKVQTSGEFGGLGINIGMRNGALTIIAPIEGTPADKAGLQAEDIILKIDDKSTLNMTIDDSIKLMRGKPKTKITLTIVRKNADKPLRVDIIRDIIKVKSVYTKIIKDENLLYIRVVKFDKNVVSHMQKALKEHGEKVKGVVLDLRNNPGGLLNQAIGVVDLFVDNGVIVSQKGRVKEENINFEASKLSTYKDIPLTVLINPGSASASEIVSGALQDHKRAIIIGQKSFGKGSVQVILPVNNKDAIRLTIARYYLPSGRTIQAKGVDPDIIIAPGVVPSEEENEFQIKEAQLKKHLKGELDKVDKKIKKKKVAKETKKDKDKYITKKDIQKDIQLKTAIDTIKTILIIKKGAI